LILSKLYILAPSNSQRNPSTLIFEVAPVKEMLPLHATICKQVNQNDLTMFNKYFSIQQRVLLTSMNMSNIGPMPKQFIEFLFGNNKFQKPSIPVIVQIGVKSLTNGNKIAEIADGRGSEFVTKATLTGADGCDGCDDWFDFKLTINFSHSELGGSPFIHDISSILFALKR